MAEATLAQQDTDLCITDVPKTEPRVAGKENV
ncbi:hypothetical protein PC129_g21689 [Phytophthora cactorum]|uniref:Uncharacterized protein n=1 Tax=Phytophthora cactorum TaxID=29920 RepID=A0A329SSD4_9STRA|nr:hypothetical protein PC111_g21975 [Phytophthora cactorum]KAG2796205.1 hypothetical protein PC112_g22304 [Phytophthora cactorum]KAG2841073.1 hypothetical protein PC113_g19105 [Phytophthora cactorum]KAG2875235.1 hypothetical protein PC114_g24839 [Phytophthora cactorum]KAG2881922.1 hypothetical protein PC115_g22089 [Phytophthora cactorum]